MTRPPPAGGWAGQRLAVKNQKVDQGSEHPRGKLEGNEDVAQRFPETCEEEGLGKNWPSYTQAR